MAHELFCPRCHSTNTMDLAVPGANRFSCFACGLSWNQTAEELAEYNDDRLAVIREHERYAGVRGSDVEFLLARLDDAQWEIANLTRQLSSTPSPSGAMSQ